MSVAVISYDSAHGGTSAVWSGVLLSASGVSISLVLASFMSTLVLSTRSLAGSNFFLTKILVISLTAQEGQLPYPMWTFRFVQSPHLWPRLWPQSTLRRQRQRPIVQTWHLSAIFATSSSLVYISHENHKAHRS